MPQVISVIRLIERAGRGKEKFSGFNVIVGGERAGRADLACAVPCRSPQSGTRVVPRQPVTCAGMRALETLF